MRVKTNSNGDAFTLPIDFSTPINTIFGTKYSLSMFSLINCPKAGCEAANDKISVQIKEGVLGTYKEVISITGRIHDTRWIQDSFNFIASSDRVYVRLIKIISYCQRLFFCFLFLDSIYNFKSCQSGKNCNWSLLY